ncbi:hypothetical protein K432DRAFT_377711 [Lepidopterella palustris CBS 459.81]|uniref:ABM domain-containing protein n=1 Tax=Lepidopterella palustris CBS 459.81 TaxID=1314670 RepID=A0A8E2EJV9_9PEZI|nr:hypothetical protein K432DRAFT_377711 [Lepidopterella palustris CBS 459.81]
MPVLEVCQLRLKDNISATDEVLLKNLSAVRSIIKTNSQFYHCLEDPTRIYILGIWPTLEAHQAFLASAEKEDILGIQDDQLEFQWMIHMGLDSMASLPLDAPVMAIARLFIKDGGHADAYARLVANHRSLIVDATKPYKVVDGWRCDLEPGKHEALMFTGWESVEAHKAFTAKAREENEEYATVRDHYEGMEVRHARNMER